MCLSKLQCSGTGQRLKSEGYVLTAHMGALVEDFGNGFIHHYEVLFNELPFVAAQDLPIHPFLEGWAHREDDLY